jgi:hypothetical protein
MALFTDISNFINQELGLSTGNVSNGGPGSASAPWTNDPSIAKDTAFWKPQNIDPTRWNKLYPYRLIVVDVSRAGKPQVVGGSGFSRFSGQASNIAGEKGLSYVITQTASPGSWEVVLPITPQQLKVTDQFAINTSATMRGIVEEHNGLKFKTITASGTTGIWPRKPTAGGRISNPTALGSIAGGTLEAAQGLIGNINKVATMFAGDHPNRATKNTRPENNEAGIFSTGYYQALYLGQFFERYAEAKKNPKNKGWRLVFDMPKQNQSFIVTPMAFELNQSERKPNEMIFSMQLKAWKRIDLQQDVKSTQDTLPALDANLFQRIVGVISSTRRILGSATNLIKAVRSDFQKSFNILRQTSLAVKDTAGLTFSVVDLPRQIIDDFNSAINSAWITSSKAYQRGADRHTSASGDSLVLRNPLSGKETSSAQKAGSVISSVLDKQKVNEGLSNDEIASGALGKEAAARLETDSINNIFENPEENFDLFNNLLVDNLVLSPEQQRAIENELLSIRLLTVNDFRSFRAELASLAYDIADSFGAGDATYASVYGLPTPKTRPIPMTLEENEILQALYEVIQAFDLLTSTKAYDDLTIQDPMDFVGGLANESGIDFEDFTSKILAPVPFGLTIEEIAARYMGDSSKWLEIVTLNRLRSPYIDEVGFTYDLLSNAEGRQFNIDDTDDNLYVGQKIIISSDTVPQISRKIVSVEKIGDNNFLVTVDGLADLDTLQTSDNARMQGYLPGTVNSQNQIYIPINQPADVDDRVYDIVNVPTTALNKLAKVDFLLTDQSDIAINSVGDFRLATGLTNLIQALKLKIRTQKGTLLKHLGYGVGLTHGVSVADIENGEIIKSLNAMVAADSRFESIESININLNGSTMSVNMVIRIANGSGIVPITFDIKAA